MIKGFADCLICLSSSNPSFATETVRPDSLLAARRVLVYCVSLTVCCRDCFVPRKDGLVSIIGIPGFGAFLSGVSKERFLRKNLFALVHG